MRVAFRSLHLCIAYVRLWVPQQLSKHTGSITQIFPQSCDNTRAGLTAESTLLRQAVCPELCTALCELQCKLCKVCSAICLHCANFTQVCSAKHKFAVQTVQSAKFALLRGCSSDRLRAQKAAGPVHRDDAGSRSEF